MKLRVPVEQLSAISLLSAVGVVVRAGLGWVAYSLPAASLPFGFSLYGIFIKIGLTETLAFVSGFALGSVQGFMTGALIVVVSDILSMYGPGLWTPFIAMIIGLLGICGGFFRRFGENPGITFFGVAAVTLTIVSEFLQNLWFAWYMWAFYMPETPFLMVLATSLLGGVASIVAALINNVVLFVMVAPTTINMLRRWVVLKAPIRVIAGRPKAGGIFKGPKSSRLARLAVFSALSVIGSFLHPPSPIQTVAFDSLPGFFVALYFGAVEGALVCGTGHIATSIINGFPLGMLHFPIALGMAMAGGAMGLVNKTDRRWGYIPASAVGVAVNTGLFVVVIPTLGLAAALAFAPLLLLAASLNAVAAALTYLGVRRRLQTS